MTIKESFTAVEWTILTELPVRIVACAITVDPVSGLGAIIEEVTGLTQLSQGATKRSESELVQEVFSQYKENGEGEAQALGLSQKFVEKLFPETLIRAEQVAQLLATHVDETEAAAYKDWLLETAEVICASAKSGGILGLGGQRVSDAEAEFLSNLEAAFSGPAAAES